MKKSVFKTILSLLLIIPLVVPVFSEENEVGNNSSAAVVAENGEAAPAENTEPTYEATVQMVDQWVGESTTKRTTAKEFTAPTDKLGNPEANSGLFRSLAKIFLGWSTEPVETQGKRAGLLPAGAKIFTEEDTIDKPFPNGIPADAKLYAVYFELQPGRPLSTNQIFMGLALLGIRSRITEVINKENKIILNKNVSDEETLLTTDLFESSVDAEANERIIIDYADLTKSNEVKLESSFSTNNSVAMLMYRNPNAGYQPTLFNAKYEQYMGSETGFPLENPDYTYMDLNIELDEKLNMPEALYLEFESYAWRPLYLVNENGEKLEVVNPADNSSLGNTHTSLNTLVSNQNPAVFFKVLNPTRSKNIKMRTILRHNYTGRPERFSLANITPSAGSVGEELVADMKYRAYSSDMLKTKLPNLTEEEISKSVITVKKEAIENMIANPEAEEKIVVDGNIDGLAVADAGSLGGFSLRGEARLRKIGTREKIIIKYVKRPENNPPPTNKDIVDIEWPWEKKVKEEPKEKDLVPDTRAFAGMKQ